MKTFFVTLLALAALAASAHAQLDASAMADVTSQVDSFWQQLFDGSSYSSGFLASLGNMTDDDQKLNIPDKEVNVLQTLLPGNAASEIVDTVDQALLSGLQLADELEAEFCTPAYLQKGVKYPTECEGPQFVFTISGGYCTIDDDTQAVTCVKPQVTLDKVAGTCTLKYTSPTTVFDKECKVTKVFGEADSGVLATTEGQTYDLSNVYNLTQTTVKSDNDQLSNWFTNFLSTGTPESASSANATVSTDSDSDDSTPDSSSSVTADDDSDDSSTPDSSSVANVTVASGDD